MKIELEAMSNANRHFLQVADDSCTIQRNKNGFLHPVFVEKARALIRDSIIHPEKPDRKTVSSDYSRGYVTISDRFVHWSIRHGSERQSNSTPCEKANAGIEGWELILSID